MDEWMFSITLQTSEGNIGVLTRVSWSFLAHSPKQKAVISLLTLSDVFWLEPFPGSSVWKSNPLQSIMIRKMILCNNCNLNKWPLAYMYVHVQILPGNTHAFLYTMKPIKSHSGTLYLNTPSLRAPPVVLKLVLSLHLHIQLQNRTDKYEPSDFF